MAQVAIVSDIVADLRIKPIPPTDIRHLDRLQETQLLYGDSVQVLKEQETWAYVEVDDQLVYSENRGWHGYPGWIEKNSLTFGSRGILCNEVISAKNVPFSCVDGSSLTLLMGTKVRLLEGNQAELSTGLIGHLPPNACAFGGLPSLFCHLGDPYHWGGLSSFTPAVSNLTGLDCSGLVHLYFRLQKIRFARNASDQYRMSTQVKIDELQSGDLIFKKNLASNRIDHVMLYLGEDKILESTALTSSVRITTATERLGAPLKEITLPYQYDGSEYLFASFLKK
jgi:hypothetical protein